MNSILVIIAITVSTLIGFMAGRTSVTGVEINRGDRSRTMVAGTAHATASITAHPVRVVTSADLNAYVAKVCPKAGLPIYPDEAIISPFNMVRCLDSAAQDTREAREGSVTQRLPSRQDPQTAAWYRMMAEKGYVPMTIMVPK